MDVITGSVGSALVLDPTDDSECLARTCLSTT